MSDPPNELSPGELSDLRRTIRAFLADHGTATPESPSTWSHDGWAVMATQLGLQGVGIAEDLGGAGLGRAVQALVHEEMGRCLFAGPYLATAAWAASALGQLVRIEARPESRARLLLERIGAGESALGAPALVEDAWPDLVSSDVRSGVEGVVVPVQGADAPDGVLVPVRLDGVPALVHLHPQDTGVQYRRLESVDVTRPWWSLHLSGAHPDTLAMGAAAIDAVRAAHDAHTLALAAECVGICDWALKATVDYVGQREQFGRLIGSFQSVKHQCVDMLVALETARAALALALACDGGEDDDGSDRRASMAAARVHCGRSAFAATDAAIHLHGGIGFTWEHRAHLYYRRAKTNQMVLAGRGDQHEVIASAAWARHAAGAAR